MNMASRSQRVPGWIIVAVTAVCCTVTRGQYKFEQGECVSSAPCASGNCNLVSDPPEGDCYAWNCTNGASNQVQHCQNASGSTKCYATLEATHACTSGSCKIWTCVYDSASGFCKTTDSSGGDCRCPNQGGDNYAPDRWIAISCTTGT
jgi:hypothetical protein